MSLPVLSIVAFAIAIIISCVSQINVGFLSIAFAFIIGVFFGGMKVADVAAGFPTNLFLILVGVTLLFSQASVNGTLDKVAKQSVKLARGNVGVIPVLFFSGGGIGDNWGREHRDDGAAGAGGNDRCGESRNQRVSDDRCRLLWGQFRGAFPVCPDRSYRQWTARANRDYRAGVADFFQ